MKFGDKEKAAAAVLIPFFAQHVVETIVAYERSSKLHARLAKFCRELTGEQLGTIADTLRMTLTPEQNAEYIAIVESL